MSDVTPAAPAAPAVNVSPNPGSVTGAAAPSTPPSWTTGFTDELKGYVDAKGFKDAQSVVESYRNFEKIKGVPQERLLTLPEKDEDPSWNDVWKRLGRPDQPKDYQLEVPKEFGVNRTENDVVVHGIGRIKIETAEKLAFNILNMCGEIRAEGRSS